MMKIDGKNSKNLSFWINNKRTSAIVNRSTKKIGNNLKLLSKYTVTLLDTETSEEVLESKFNELPDEILTLILYIKWKISGFVSDVRIKKQLNHTNQLETRLTLKIKPRLNKWIYDYSFETFQVEFSKIFNNYVNNFEDFQIYVSDISEDGFDVNCKVTNPFQRIKDLLDNFSRIYTQIENETKTNLDSIHKPSIFTKFLFPNELKFICEQYLIYFGQFLSDLGIDATANLKEETGKVLFSVTPTNGIEALDKIREALVVYLNLPSSPIVYDDSFAAMRLQQQIESLQHSQRMTEREIRSSERELRLTQTVIEHQDKIIFQKDTIIEQQNKVIEKITSKSIMMDSLENKEEFVKIFDGLEVGESKELKEKIGIKFHPVTSLKTLGKKLIGRKDEITSLNLNDKADKENN